jgi:hypothetical protein
VSPTPTLSPPPPLWGLEVGELVVAGVAVVLFVVGLAAAMRTFSHLEPEDPPRVRTLIVLHALSRGGFWIGLGAVLMAQAFRGVFPGDPLWLVVIPLAMAGLRLLTAAALARRLPDDDRAAS